MTAFGFLLRTNWEMRCERGEWANTENLAWGAARPVCLLLPIPYQHKRRPHARMRVIPALGDERCDGAAHASARPIFSAAFIAFAALVVMQRRPRNSPPNAKRAASARPYIKNARASPDSASACASGKRFDGGCVMIVFRVKPPTRQQGVS